MSSLEPYFRESPHAFVVTWIKSWSEVDHTFSPTQHTRRGYDRTLALFMSFPSDVAYFPMRASSTYGSVTAPVQLKISGYVQPKSNIDLRDIREPVSHFRREGRPIWRGNRLDVRSDGGPFRYTRFRLEVPANRFVDDLRFVPFESRGLHFAEHVLDAKWMWFLWIALGAIALTLLSYLSAGIAGFCLVRRWRGYARLGFWNLATLYGLHAGLRDSKSPAAATIRQITRGRAKFIMIFTIAFMLITWGLQAAINGMIAID